MTKYFFDITNPALSKYLFAQTQLARQDKVFYDSCSGQFPVISISFSRCYASTWEKMETLLRSVIIGAYRDHRYLLESEEFLYEDERLEFEAILKKKPSATYEEALMLLTELLHRYHKKKVIVLIDEYDKPVNEAYQEGYFKEALKFLTSAFTGCLKSNPHLEKGLMTGVLRVAKAGYLSGLNNLEVYSFLDEEFADKYGVSEQEMEEALKYEDLSSHADEVRQFYDGYDTAIEGQRLYNPWSVVNYLKKKKIVPYWVETGRYDFQSKAILSMPLETMEKISQLLIGESCHVPFELDVNFSRIGQDSNVLWSLLFFSGYITGKSNGGQLLEARIPTKEIEKEFSKILNSVIGEKRLQLEYNALINALLDANALTFQSELCGLARKLFSAQFDVGRFPEAWYHAFLLVCLYNLVSVDYHVESNREKGMGFPDITLQPPIGKPAIIVEMKIPGKDVRDAVKRDEDLEKYAEKGMKQIEEKEYRRGLLPHIKECIYCSVACCGKFVNVKMKKISL